jgi:hypothetical protein
MYHEHGAKVHRTFFANLLRRIHVNPMAEADLPSAGRISLLHFPEERRYVLHLLYAPPLQRGRCLVIEDIPALRDVAVRLRLPEKEKAVRLEPDGQSLSVSRNGDALEIVIAEFRCHAAVCVDY